MFLLRNKSSCSALGFPLSLACVRCYKSIQNYNLGKGGKERKHIVRCLKPWDAEKYEDHREKGKVEQYKKANEFINNRFPLDIHFTNSPCIFGLSHLNYSE